MINNRIENAAMNYLSENGGSCKYKFQGKNYKITPKFLKNAPVGLQQSFGNFASKNQPPSNGEGQGDGKGKPGKPGKGEPKDNSDQEDDGERGDKIPDTPKELQESKEEKEGKETKQAINNKGGSTKNPAKINSTEIKRQEEVKKYLLKWANTEIILDGPLNMPKVFKALITEPQTAFDYRKSVIEVETNLTLFVDTAVGYHSKDRFLHNTIIKTAEKIKGINVFSGHALCNITYKGNVYPYYTDIIKVLPKKMTRKIVVFTQGCGHTADDTYKDINKKIYFCTCFEPKCTCGCAQIPKAEKAGLIMNYGILSIEDLSKINPILTNF